MAGRVAGGRSSPSQQAGDLGETLPDHTLDHGLAYSRAPAHHQSDLVVEPSHANEFPWVRKALLETSRTSRWSARLGSLVGRRPGRSDSPAWARESPTAHRPRREPCERVCTRTRS